MEVTNRPSKITSPKKSNRISKSNSGIGGSLGKSSKTSSESILSRVFQIELNRFCPRKLFYIFLIVENDDNSASLVDDLMEMNTKYEEESSLTFISREDTLALMDITDNHIFPSQLKPLLLSVIESIKNNTSQNMSLISEIQLLKLKLIQVMYQQYVDQVKKNEKEKSLETLLTALTKECKRKQKKDERTKNEEEDKNKIPTQESSKKNKKDDALKDTVKEEEIDYTSIPVDKDGISYEENIFDYIWFYCIKGYYNADIIQNLIDQANVPICAIINVSNGKENILNRGELLDSFWDHIKQYFFRNTVLYKTLENTILMQFTPSKDDEQISLVLLEDFVFMLRRIVNVKLTYLKYLRHLKINKKQHSYVPMPLECLHEYNKSLRYIPSECINSELILDAILKEVCLNVESDRTSDSSLKGTYVTISSNKSVHCVDPLHNFDAFAANMKKNSSHLISNINTDVSGFLVHENNVLTKILKSYNYIGPKIAEMTLNFIKRIPILCGFDKFVTTPEDISHLHDIDPSMTLKLTSEGNMLNNFLYIFLFNTFTNKMKSPTRTFHYDLLNNLSTFNIIQFWDEIQPKFEGEMANFDENSYNKSMIHFRWKENLSKDLLFQEVFDASNEFMYADRKYSPETDNFLIVFSDKLDDFGTNTKMFDEVVRTPICFRDFCRYTTIEDSTWLQENKTKIDESTFKVLFDENCPGARNVKANLKIFQEYSYLLDENMKEEIEDDTRCQSSEEKRIIIDNSQGVSFSDIFTDLQNCPSSVNILRECESTVDDNHLLAYDLGTNLFKVTGKVTTFCSQDNVKVTVDNTGFLQYPEKCTFNVICCGNTLTLHSRESLITEPYIATLQLKDESRISFIVRKVTIEPESLDEVKESSDLQLSSGNEKQIDNVIYESSETPNDQNAFENDVDAEESETSLEQFVHCVDEDYIKDVLEGKSLEDLSTNDNYEDLMESLLNSRENNGIIYKVNAKSNYIKRRNNDLIVPLENAFRNILPVNKISHKEPKPYQIYTKRFKSASDKKSDLEIKNPIDFRICLPTGLFIRAHPCVVDKNNLMIKQEYAEEKTDVPIIVQHEEFRLFSNQGLVMIKKIDGTISILKANGDIIDFEKPTDGSGENNTVHRCHCSTFDDYRNKLNKLLKDLENCDFMTSRRGHITSKQNHILDSKILKVLEQFDVPYIKKSVTKFDGKIIKIQGDKISQKQLYYLTSQADFFTGDIFFERNDDFRSTFDRSGCQQSFFPDGTIISNSIDIAEELVDDFVFVKVTYKYAHPYYATVKYNFDNTSEIILNNDVVIKEMVDGAGFTVKMKEELSVSMSDEKISIRKICTECHGKFKTHFNIKPFKDSSWNPSAEFMHVKDTYDKHFYSDFVGNCSRNGDYITGGTNSLKCNHFVKTNYKKLFVVNRDFTGDMFYTNDTVKGKMKEMESRPHATAITYDMVSNENKTVFDCRQKFYIAYSERFLNYSVDRLPQYFKKSTSSQHELYTTFRMFIKMFQSVDEIATHICNMQQVFFSDVLDYLKDSSIYNNTALLSNDLELYYKQYEQEVLAEEIESIDRKRKQNEEFEKKKIHDVKCSCIKQKLTMQEKIVRWKEACEKYRTKIRNKDIPTYFKSEFCKIVE